MNAWIIYGLGIATGLLFMAFIMVYEVVVLRQGARSSHD